MTMCKLAIIGTAGRKEDQGLLTAQHYHRMTEGAIKLISHLEIDPKELLVVSGGAAWSDHVAVNLVLLGVIAPEQLTIYLPAPLVYYGFEADDQSNQRKKRTADTANYYHKMFSSKVGIDSLNELNRIKQLGTIFDEEGIVGGFHARNALVARFLGTDGHVLAFTTGGSTTNQNDWTIRNFESGTSAETAGLKDGGTAHCFNLCKGPKHHAKIGPIVDSYINI